MAKGTRKKRKIEEESSISLSAKPKRARKGKLEGIQEMPLDILFEIFHHLLPTDLLRLARLTKDFRRMLMRRSSTSVWQSARSNALELPNPPDGMAEPAWAHLVFDSQCHYCFASGVRNVDWLMRRRICKKCASEHMERYSHESYKLIAQYHLHCRSDGKFGYSIIEAELDAVRNKLWGLDETAKNLFLNDRKIALEKGLEHERLCVEWAERWSNRRSVELTALKTERYNAIVERLRGLGWGKEVDLELEPSQKHLVLRTQKCVNQPTRLTEKIWKNMEKQLLELMGKLRDIRLKNERDALLRERKSIATEILRTYKRAHLPYTQFMPGPADFCAFALVKDVIQQPSKVQVDETSFSHIVPLLPDLIDAWRTEKMKELRKHVASSTAGQEVNLHLATSAFICEDEEVYSIDDERAYFFPQMLTCPCLTTAYCGYNDSSLDDPPILIKAETGFTFERTAWDPSGLILCTSLQAEIKTLVQLAGLEPDKATTEDMDHIQNYFLCSTCLTQGSHHGSLYGWREATNHLLREHVAEIDIPIIIDEEGTEELSMNFDEEYRFDSVSWELVPAYRLSDIQVTAIATHERKWYCAHCFDLPTEPDSKTLGDMKIHVVDRHDVSHPREDTDYFTPFPSSSPSISRDHLQVPVTDLDKLVSRVL